MPRLWGQEASGNCYKVKLLASHLGVPLEWVRIDVTKGESRTPEFLAMSPAGQVPLLRGDDGSFLAESGAILWYLGQGTTFVPPDKLAAARMLQWMFFEQYRVEPNIATSRYWIHLLNAPERFAAQIAAKRDPGLAALAVMESHLAHADGFPGGALSLADIALYGYVHCAPEGGFALDGFPRIRAWIARVAGTPGHIGMHEPLRAPARYLEAVAR
ncbi:MAG: glutathione S-transferase family protein [Proteobacteria bacterium]|nr:glutathione S-transferase family protein [Pseudomonadota bacterium]